MVGRLYRRTCTGSIARNAITEGFHITQIPVIQEVDFRYTDLWQIGCHGVILHINLMRFVYRILPPITEVLLVYKCRRSIRKKSIHYMDDSRTGAYVDTRSFLFNPPLKEGTHSANGMNDKSA